MNVKFIQICLIIIILKPETYARNFASSADLKMLLKTEEQVIKALKTFVKAEKKRINFLEKYLARSKLEYEIAIKDVPHYLGNPINAYTIIKRLGPDLAFAEQIIRNKTELKTPNAVFPTEEDLRNSMLGVMGLLNVYGLQVTQMANGILNTSDGQFQEVYTEYVTPMTASDCYSIGMALFSDSEYNMALSWLEEAYNKLEGVSCDICPVDIIDVIDHIAKCYHELDNMDKFIEWTEKRIFLRPKDHESMVQAKYIDVLRHRQNVLDKKAGEEKPTFKTKHKRNFTDMCLGRKGNYTSSNFMPLSCYYAHGPHPILILAPMKAELLHHDPDITIFHDVLNDKEIEELQTIATPVLWETTNSDEIDYRNAEAASLDDRAFPVVARVSRRSLDLSGFSSVDCEHLKVVSYGIGGFYRQHWDTRLAQRLEIDGRQRRHGTIVFYLSDVEQGGATIFPLLDLTIFPKKGAALFWMNLLPSGEGDVLTLHAACPVFQGNKWIAVKWPHRLNHYWCPVWIRNNKTVTTRMYKKILEERDDKYRRLMVTDKKSRLEHSQYFGRFK